MTIFWLCEELGTLALYDEESQEPKCQAHQSFDCVAQFVPANKEEE